MKKIGDRDYIPENIPEYIGWYQPHRPVNWTGEILDKKTGELVKELSMTKQEFKDETDVNNILKQYSPAALQELLLARAGQGQFIDLPSNFEFMDAMNIVVEGQRAFENLPSSVRNRFANDPARFLEFMQNEDNQEEAIKLGLATRKVDPPPPPKPLAQEIAEAITSTTGGDGGSPPSKGAKAP